MTRIEELEQKPYLSAVEHNELLRLREHRYDGEAEQPLDHKRSFMRKVEALTDQQLKGLEILLISKGYIESDQTIAKRAPADKIAADAAHAADADREARSAYPGRFDNPEHHERHPHPADETSAERADRLARAKRGA